MRCAPTIAKPVSQLQAARVKGLDSRAPGWSFIECRRLLLVRVGRVIRGDDSDRALREPLDQGVAVARGPNRRKDLHGGPDPSVVLVAKPQGLRAAFQAQWPAGSARPLRGTQPPRPRQGGAMPPHPPG